jgi:2-polyprenyl-3-methyl-5-hydroxy-6-metoxy-1,4-benzoquinol methylase
MRNLQDCLSLPGATSPDSELLTMSSSQSVASLQSFFDKQAAAWADRYRSATYKQRVQFVGEIVRKEVLRLHRPASTIKLLDFGCGSGMLLSDAVNSGLNVTGVDNSKPMIDAARRQLAGFGEQVNLEWLPDSSGEGSFERESYDIVLCISVLEFVPDIQGLLSRLCTCVAIGGVLLVSVPNRHSWLRGIEGFIHRHPHIFRQFSRLDHLTRPDSYLKFQAHQLTRNELTRIVQRHGMRAESHRFHVAPVLPRRIECLEQVGMMLIATFRKS